VARYILRKKGDGEIRPPFSLFLKCNVESTALVRVKENVEKMVGGNASANHLVRMEAGAERRSPFPRKATAEKRLHSPLQR